MLVQACRCYSHLLYRLVGVNVRILRVNLTLLCWPGLLTGPYLPHCNPQWGLNVDRLFDSALTVDPAYSGGLIVD